MLYSLNIAFLTCIVLVACDRFDPEVKQWKERGVGDIKILNHPAKNTFRILLRRDQVHKIACNHYITVEQMLEPMQRYFISLKKF